MNHTAPSERRVLIPQKIEPRTLSGAGRPLRVDRLGGETMGTRWAASVALSSTVGPQAVERALLEVFARVIEQMSPWRPDSDLSRFNRAEAGTWQVLPAEFFEVLLRALQVAKETAGAYNPTVGRAIDLLGFGATPRTTECWDPIAFQQSLDGAGWSRIVLDPETRRACQPGGVHLDLSSIAKGFAVDWAARALDELGCVDFLMEIGGEVRARGCKPDGQPWWCRLDYPDPPDGKPRAPETILALCDHALASSGNTLRRRRLGDRWQGHIVHGVHGELRPSSLETVFVLHPDCVTADAYATALFALGPEDGPTFARQHGLAALFVDRHGARFGETSTPAWQSLID